MAKKHGLWILYLPVNQAWAVMWHGSVLRLFSEKWEAEEEIKDLLRGL